jgi:S-adenosylmethionine:tRNA ribosyltransferase-isomerase
LTLRTDEFDYELPTASIAQRPAAPRESARLLDCRGMDDRHFFELPGMLDEGDLVVLNTTRVRAARLRGTRDSGGAVEVLLLSENVDGEWEALIRPARRVRPGLRLLFGTANAIVLERPESGRTMLRFDEDVEKLAGEVGEMPLPPYITAPLADPSEYQTVFAKELGSAAAPTAGLHFSTGVLAEFADRGVDVASIDLQVGVDTFRPIAEETIDAHRMHSERFVVPPETATAFEMTKRRGGKVVAIGTTVVRALESAVADGRLRPGPASTELFIRPGYRFGAVDAVVTNFHVPRSTLIVLVAALVGEMRWKHIYETALERGYRFLSFGDAMFAERA